MMLQLAVDVFLSAGYLLQCPCDFVVQFVQVALGVFEGVLDAVFMLMHLFHMNPPILQHTVKYDVMTQHEPANPTTHSKY